MYGSICKLIIIKIILCSRDTLLKSLLLFSAEPMKKKKKADMSVVIQRDAKKRRRLEKNIRKLEAKGKKLKPIEEIDGNRSVLKTLR